MSYEYIKNYLLTFYGRSLDNDIFKHIKDFKLKVVEEENQVLAKDLWCLETIYKIIKEYLIAFEQMKTHDFFEAWCSLDRADIQLSFLRKHLDYEMEFANIVFVEKVIVDFQKLYPYEWFTSRETVIKKERCSICGEIMSLRSPCTHEVGEIYDGEMCSRIVEEADLIAIALVRNPFDKYTVIKPQDIEYNYLMLEHLIDGLSNPFEKWQVNIEERIDEAFKELGRNDICICGSDIKYKKCCLKNKKNVYLHYQIDFLNKDESEIKEIKNVRFSTVKPKNTL